MHKVKRIKKPQSLVNSQKEWTKDLIEQINDKGSYSKVENKYKIKYNTSSVKKALKEMYDVFCCYCEGRITTTGFARIEHRKPRSKFPELCYEWTNMHIACEVCNKNKGELWNEKYPILDAAVDYPKEHLEFKKSFICPKNNSLRGKTTIDHVKLNREELELARRIILNRVFTLVLRVNQTGDIKKEKILRDYFQNLFNEDKEFTSFKKYILDTYLSL